MAERAALLSLSTFKNPAFELTVAPALSILRFPAQKAVLLAPAVVAAVAELLPLAAVDPAASPIARTTTPQRVVPNFLI
jgi:hypothetical protein